VSGLTEYKNIADASRLLSGQLSERQRLQLRVLSMRVSIFKCAAVLSAIFLSTAANSATPESSTMLVHGEATVSVPPDLAQIDIGVITQAAQSEAAAQQNQAKSAQLIEHLRRLLPSFTLRTINVAVNPNYRYPREGTPQILGYTATSTVRVNLTDLTLLSKVIDSATRAGASNINRLTFGLRDEKAARGRALAEAADQAKAGAESLAATLQLKLMRIARVEEVQPVIISPGREVEISPLKEESSSSSSLTPGSIQIHASINVTFETAER
jgi:uncharacterized protein YggE